MTKEEFKEKGEMIARIIENDSFDEALEALKDYDERAIIVTSVVTFIAQFGDWVQNAYEQWSDESEQYMDEIKEEVKKWDKSFDNLIRLLKELEASEKELKASEN